MRQRSMTSKMTWIRPPTPGLLVILEAEVARWSRRGHFEFQYDPTAFRLKRLPIARMFGSLAFARTQFTKPRIRTMSFSMSQASLPVFDIGLNALSSILDKAEAHAAAKNINSSVLLHSRLSPEERADAEVLGALSQKNSRFIKALPFPAGFLVACDRADACYEIAGASPQRGTRVATCSTSPMRSTSLKGLTPRGSSPALAPILNNQDRR